MHRGFDTVGNRGGGGAGGICGATRKHALTICAFVALVLVVVTLLTRHNTERGGAGAGGGFSSALSSEIRFNADYQQAATQSHYCVHGMDFEDFGSTFQGVSRKECATMCYMMPNCKVWQHSPKENRCITRYSNASSLVTSNAEACIQTAHSPRPMTEYLGVAHWQGCYFKSDRPFLLDGADEVSRLGSKIIKVAFNFHEPWNDYPWHSKWPEKEWKTWTPPPVEVAKHPYWQELFKMDFDTIILIAYSNVARSSPDPDDWKAWVDPWYWIYKDPTNQQLKDETEQFYELTEHLLTTFPNKTFILQNWEGDWTLRQDLPVDQRYNTSIPVAEFKTQRMIKWLTARQLGVTRARRAVGSKAISQVYHAAEVNLVRASAQDYAKKGHSKRHDMVTAVLPKVALDMVSYSSYDSTIEPGYAEGNFWSSLRLVQRMHRKTAESPERAVYVGEFGVNSMATDWDDTMEKVKNALNVGAAANLAYMIYWQMFDNALNPKGREHYGIDRCDSRMIEKGPVYDQQYIEGFFIQHPDLEYYRPTAAYWQKMLHGEVNSSRRYVIL